MFRYRYHTRQLDIWLNQTTPGIEPCESKTKKLSRSRMLPRRPVFPSLPYPVCSTKRVKWRQRISFIGGRRDLQCACQREQGYRDALKEAGIPVDPDLIQDGDFTTDTATVCARKLMDLPDRPTAVFAANDQSAIGVLRAAGQVGLSVPEDLSVVGFDSIPGTAYLKPALTTVDQFDTEMGYAATMMLMDLVQGNTLERNQHKIPTKLVIRDSCRAIGTSNPGSGSSA
jgi:DNA-binding LacI/PurR family transcriptional regulator